MQTNPNFDTDDNLTESGGWSGINLDKFQKG